MKYLVLLLPLTAFANTARDEIKKGSRSFLLLDSNFVDEVRSTLLDVAGSINDENRDPLNSYIRLLSHAYQQKKSRACCDMKRS